MEIELLRDLIIIISGFVIVLSSIFVVVVLYSMYRNIKGFLKSMETTAAKIEEFTTIISDGIAKPLFQAVGIAQAVSSGISAINKIFGKGG